MVDLNNINIPSLELRRTKQVHFIGIGGIGVSAIARMMMLEGKIVSGSDQSETLVTEELRKLGATIYIGHKADQVPAEADLVIYTIAVPPSNPEFAKAEELGLPMLTYPEALGMISSDKYTIAVAGTHGKTTTTGMLAKIFLDAGLDPTVVVGSFLKDFQSNFVAGTGKYFIAEACEYRRSFLNLTPQILVITNIEADHLDYYKDLADIQAAFRELAHKVPADGFIVCDTADPHLKPVLAGVVAKVVDYPTQTVEGLALRFPGAHLVADAKAALGVALACNLNEVETVKALNSFSGTWRRFDFKGVTATGARVYDDYAHHPDEVRATLQAAREEVQGGQVVAIFQPHLYSRTKDFLLPFAEALVLADRVILLPIYAARETSDGSIDSADLAKAIRATGHQAVETVPDFTAAAEAAGVAGQGDLIMVMGAGDVTAVSELLVA
ncbi:MAG: hypothetical protein A2589_02355 [Candidatus Vogelbacteria bacterium RIFOXYD1_FULL_46_19]|uniref:UDP-N-acetylmuramate--L-alanine ligase n=1 Tax=Candidatus Vogelbacteria bacterium RIFOXYD1_FULL_46_19 TaxID=1802439 RepID=A0A1G2QGI0_9BACT|nr:MAG: hypothetical protein A2589_02355 [Candidatus Vogelbacteria bacterium RIFOXYD1_FULL_46_19]